MINVRYYFDIWKQKVQTIKKEEWTHLHQEELEEQEYAFQNNMDSIYWCWNCKYGDCDVH